MVKYLKTKRGYKLKKKRVTRKKYNTKNKTRKIMSGGTINDLLELNRSVKTIVLIGEFHTPQSNEAYSKIIRKQKIIIDDVVEKFGADRTVFYSELPQDAVSTVHYTLDSYHSSVIIKYATSKVNTKLSRVTKDDRCKGLCDDDYSREILEIFDNPQIFCVMVQIGLLHIPELKRIIEDKHKDIKIVIINTVSREQLIPLIPEIQSEYPSLFSLLHVETPYDIFIPQLVPVPEVGYMHSSPAPSGETFKVIVLTNKYGDKIYQCPVCESRSGTGAVKYPQDPKYFHHKDDCINKNKIPSPGWSRTKHPPEHFGIKKKAWKL